MFYPSEQAEQAEAKHFVRNMLKSPDDLVTHYRRCGNVL